ncbi:MAG: response regulator transcription factor [Oscillospiraceae bacterium]|nr:response regulator transcription factor [Oscillospiraceae bacterium]
MPNILLIEDDSDLARNLTKYLNTEGFSATHVFGQTDGIRAFESGKFDCVLLDISLEDGNGFSICAQIKASSDIPVIFLTASADETCTVAGFEVGADDYINKPFRPRELVARIKNAMRKHGVSSSPQTLRCRNVTIDTARGVVTKNGNEVFLSALEYRLLLLFFSNKGILLSRERLADELWTVSGEFVSDSTLNVYIKRLRDKVEDDPQNPDILKTVRGLGYKAVEE